MLCGNAILLFRQTHTQQNTIPLCFLCLVSIDPLVKDIGMMEKIVFSLITAWLINVNS